MALTKVKAGHLVALDMAPLFVGKESGCFEKAVLDVETIFFANPGDKQRGAGRRLHRFQHQSIHAAILRRELRCSDQGDFRRGRLGRLRAQFRSPCQ